MLCTSCSKLITVIANRKCVRCQGIIATNLAIICDNCSNLEKMCSFCLKKMGMGTQSNKRKSGCRTCGK